MNGSTVVRKRRALFLMVIVKQSVVGHAGVRPPSIDSELVCCVLFSEDRETHCGFSLDMGEIGERRSNGRREIERCGRTSVLLDRCEYRIR
jgi:hypothetical protein